MLSCGHAITDIKIRLGHENIQSTTVYLHMDLTHKRSVQKKFIQIRIYRDTVNILYTINGLSLLAP